MRNSIKDTMELMMKNEKGEMDLPISHLIQAQKHLSMEFDEIEEGDELGFPLFLLSSKEAMKWREWECEWEGVCVEGEGVRRGTL